MGSDFDLIERRLDVVERAIEEIRDATRSIAESVSKIVLLEERHAETTRALERAFGALKEVEHRLREIEVELPGLREVRRWVLGMVFGVLGAVGTAVLALVVR